MEKQTQVLDASVMVKWFTKEVQTEKAIILKEKHLKKEIIIVIPDIAFTEVINSLRYKNNNEEKLCEINKNLWNLGCKVEKITESNIHAAINIAKKYDIAIYDALYIAIAKFHSCSFITSDKELYKIPNVIPLEKT